MKWSELLRPSVSTSMSFNRKDRAGPTPTAFHQQLENVRVAMLHALAAMEPASHRLLTNTRDAIQKAVEVQTLWYLRCDLLCLLSDFRGEPLARRELDTITEMFRGMVSESQLPQLRRQAQDTLVEDRSIEP